MQCKHYLTSPRTVSVFPVPLCTHILYDNPTGILASANKFQLKIKIANIPSSRTLPSNERSYYYNFFFTLISSSCSSEVHSHALTLHATAVMKLCNGKVLSALRRRLYSANRYSILQLHFSLFFIIFQCDVIWERLH